MILMKIDEENREEVLAAAVAVLERGGIVAYPTETLYGLGVKYDNREALDRLYDLKKRPSEKAMPLIIARRDQLALLAASVSDEAGALMCKFWPGPLTLVLEARAGLPERITAAGRVAVRIPGASFALSLAARAGFPLTATSANVSGRPPARDVGAIIDYFDATVDLIIDGGVLSAAEPSTLADVAGGGVRILRNGAVKL